MEVRHFKLVEAIAKQGNLTKAAEELFLTQSALSHQLKEIESQLDTQLFNRVNKKMIFTEAGKKILKSARVILNEIENTEREIKLISKGEVGNLRIATECYTSYHWLPKAMSVFNIKYPNVEISIEADATKKPINALYEGKIDLGIVSLKSSDSILSFQQLFKDQLFLLSHKNNPISQKKMISPKDFIDEVLISYASNIEEMDVFTKFLMPAGIKPKKLIYIQLTEAIIEMVRANIGVTVIAGWALKPIMKSKEIKITPFKGNKLDRIWYAAFLANRELPQYYSDFIEIIKNNSPRDKVTS